MIFKFKKAVFPIYSFLNNLIAPLKIQYYLKNKMPWSLGYKEYKSKFINESLNNTETLKLFSGQSQLPEGFGKGLDERVVEYPWIFSNISSKSSNALLDAGSTLNFKYILENKILKLKKISIFTFHPEYLNFPNYANYIYGDLRSMPFESESFEEIICQSTIEHIDMDNSMYGYELDYKKGQTKSYDYLKAIHEFERVLKPEGKLLLTFPFGIFKSYGFFQQFDTEMVSKIENHLIERGEIIKNYYLYSSNGWQIANESECANSLSHSPKLGTDKGSDGAAHSRAICVIKFVKANKC